MRARINKIVLTSKKEEKALKIDKYKDLAGILKIASEDKARKKMGLETRKLEKKAINDNCIFEPSV